MKEYQKYINALRQCAREHEDDRTPTFNIRVSDLCNDTADLLESLEQDPILDKIKAEIIARERKVKAIRNDDHCFFTAEEMLELIDKCKVESEE